MPNALHRHQYKIFRELLIEARESAAMTQTEVARKLSRPQSFVSKYERGERRLDMTEFIEVADVLGINLSEFMQRYREQVSSEMLTKTHGFATS